MSEDHADELNFNELVGNLLSSHNAAEHEMDADADAEGGEVEPSFEVQDQRDISGTEEVGNETQEHLGEELPEFGDEEEEDALAAVVASAIQSMDHQGQHDNEGEDRIPTDEGSGMDRENDKEQEDSHWAEMLQQSILQGSETGKNQADDQLDQDDETLRRAILESLSELNTVEREPGEHVEEAKESSKKSSKKKKKKKKDKEHVKEKHTSSKKKKHHSRDKDVDNREEDLLDFEDVIKGFMRQGNEAATEETSQPEVVGDEETQALVEATLRAFERELLGSQTATSLQTPKAHPRSKESTKTIPAPQDVVHKQNDSEAGSTPSVVAEDLSKNEIPSTASKKKKKRKRKKKQQKAEGKEKKDSDEDEFSKALAAMVNEVVNTSLSDNVAPPHEVSQQEAAPSDVSATLEQNLDERGSEPEEETFDLNQIMQKAMSMAFQDQSHDNFDSSAVEEFNRGLGDFSVSDLLSGSSSALKKKPSKTSRPKTTSNLARAGGKTSTGSDIDEETMRRKTSSKPSLSPEEALRKRYSQTAVAAAAAARKRIAARNKAARLQLKLERKKAREEKKLQKKQAKEQLEIERKELEEIVAKGPPYPPDLRLTKSGRPKKPYRRWTPEEMQVRASMPPEDLEKSKRVKKARKKKSKKLKRVPLSTLKKIPLFNFAKDSTPADVKVKLNGIDDTLKKIPLQSYQSELSKLAPPDTVPPGTWDTQKSTVEGREEIEVGRKSAYFGFDAGRKTVVRREKIPFHPPWAIPSQVPYALPLARRKRKEKPKDSPLSSARRRAYSRDEKLSLSSGLRNKIIPAVLLPIINTLKAAAKAKVASGASSEEANKHLVTIIRHTKKSIAESLSLARRQATRDYSAIKTERDLHISNELKSKKPVRIPIFSLSKIKQIDTREDPPIKTVSLGTDKAQTPVIKIEDEVGPTTFFSRTGPNSNAQQSKDAENEKDDCAASTTTNIVSEVSHLSTASTGSLVGEHEKDVSNEAASKQDRTVELSSTNQDDDVTSFDYDKIEKDAQKKESGERVEDIQHSLRGHEISSNGKKIASCNNRCDLQTSERYVEDVSEHNGTSSESDKKPSENEEQLTALKTVVSKGSSVTKGSLVSLKDVVDKNSVGEEQKIHEVLDDLVKEHFNQSRNELVELTDNVRNIISETIEELIPVINVQQPELSERPKRQRKGPPPVLNLDGLVPPNNLRIIPKIESSPGPLVNQRPISRARKTRKKADQPTLLYKFNVPDFKSIQGRRTMLLKRTKEYLNPEEMNTLKKEINKERKRKWREANVEKNWENDLRARLKKRASLKFGDEGSIEKTKWYNDELSKSLSEREVKQEGNSNNIVSDKKVNGNGSTNLSDNEVLNMIATKLNKLDVARLLERDLNEEAAGYQTHAQSKTSKVDVPTNLADEHHELNHPKELTLQTPITTYDDRVSYDGQEPRNDNGEVLDESGNVKRAYPDDIPVSIPLAKRPKSVCAENDK